ncbi:hypothetical protein K6V18_08585, partial [Ralstonia insidiosa]|uniref:hypothetical protein n=1 Tax=Ralstonia insidiosa TaxID=190721 RepID=UPI001C96AF06
HHPAQEGETHRQTTRTKRHLTAFGVGQFSMQILGQDSVQINTRGHRWPSGPSILVTNSVRDQQTLAQQGMARN